MKGYFICPQCGKRNQIDENFDLQFASGKLETPYKLEKEKQIYGYLQMCIYCRNKSIILNRYIYTDNEDLLKKGFSSYSESEAKDE